MKRIHRLRSQPLDVEALRKASGGRGSYCGNTLHCNACGDVDCADSCSCMATCSGTNACGTSRDAGRNDRNLTAHLQPRWRKSANKNMGTPADGESGGSNYRQFI